MVSSRKVARASGISLIIFLVTRVDRRLCMLLIINMLDRKLQGLATGSQKLSVLTSNWFRAKLRANYTWWG